MKLILRFHKLFFTINYFQVNWQDDNSLLHSPGDGERDHIDNQRSNTAE